MFSCGLRRHFSFASLAYLASFQATWIHSQCHAWHAPLQLNAVRGLSAALGTPRFKLLPVLLLLLHHVLVLVPHVFLKFNASQLYSTHLLATDIIKFVTLFLCN
jgi:hypothetical protein